MTGDEIRIPDAETFRFQRPQGRDGGRHQCRLGIPGQGQGLDIPVPDQVGQAFSQCLVHLGKDLARRRISLGQLAPHADDLSALPRKYECPHRGIPFCLMSL